MVYIMVLSRKVVLFNWDRDLINSVFIVIRAIRWRMRRELSNQNRVGYRRRPLKEEKWFPDYTRPNRYELCENDITNWNIQLNRPGIYKPICNKINKGTFIKNLTLIVNLTIWQLILSDGRYYNHPE